MENQVLTAEQSVKKLISFIQFANGVIEAHEKELTVFGSIPTDKKNEVLKQCHIVRRELSLCQSQLDVISSLVYLKAHSTTDKNQ